MSERGRDLYALLGVAPDADAREVARAYRRRLREVHPHPGPAVGRPEPRAGRPAGAAGGVRGATRPGPAGALRRAAPGGAEAGGGIGDGHRGAGPRPGPEATAGPGLADPGGTRALRAATEPLMKFADQTGLPQMMGTRSCGYGL